MSIQFPISPIPHKIIMSDAKLLKYRKEFEAWEAKTEYIKNIKKLNDIQLHINSTMKDPTYWAIRNHAEEIINFESVHQYYSSISKKVYDTLNNLLSKGTETTRNLAVGSAAVSVFSLSILFNIPQSLGVLSLSLPVFYKAIDWHNKYQKEKHCLNKCSKETKNIYDNLFKSHKKEYLHKISRKVYRDIEEEFFLKSDINQHLECKEIKKELECRKLEFKKIHNKNYYFGLFKLLFKDFFSKNSSDIDVKYDYISNKYLTSIAQMRDQEKLKYSIDQKFEEQT